MQKLTVDAGRLARAKDVPIEEGLDSRWIANKKYMVKIDKDTGDYHCGCEDFSKRKIPCKHIIAVAIQMGIECVADEGNQKSGNDKKFANYKTMGYDRWEVISAFHKELRRGDEKKALWWAEILIQAGEDVWYINNYIASIITEELCTCDYNIIYSITSTLNFKVLDDNGLYAAVIKFCRAKKWWECDTCSDMRLIRSDYRTKIKNNKKKEFLPIPEYTLDRHTRRGKKLIAEGKFNQQKWEGSWTGMWFRREAWKGVVEGEKLDRELITNEERKSIIEQIDKLDIEDVIKPKDIEYWNHMENTDDVEPNKEEELFDE